MEWLLDLLDDLEPADKLALLANLDGRIAQLTKSEATLLALADALLDRASPCRSRLA
jgi:hypothetical protein